MRMFLIALTVVASLPHWVLAQDVVRPLKTEEFLSYSINPFELEVLLEALERTRPDYGDFELRPFTEAVSSARLSALAIEGHVVNIVATGVGRPDIEPAMIPIPIPVDKGLLGFRVSLIDRNSQDQLSHVNSIEQLRQLHVGQGSDWSDVLIYRHNGIPVETASEFESLFKMLLRNRFDLFPRGLSEVGPELAEYGERYPDLAAEQHLLLRYPFCDAFYVSRSVPRLAERITAGLEEMVADGSFDALFSKHFSELLADLDVPQRVVIELANPFLPDWVPVDRDELWFDPARLP